MITAKIGIDTVEEMVRNVAAQNCAPFFMFCTFVGTHTNPQMKRPE